MPDTRTAAEPLSAKVEAPDELRAALEDVLRVFDAPFTTSPTTRSHIRRRAERALRLDHFSGARAARQEPAERARDLGGAEGLREYDHVAHRGNHEGYACGFSGPHCWSCGEPWPCRTERGVARDA